MIAIHPIDRVLHMLEGQRSALLAGDVRAATSDTDALDRLMRALNPAEIGPDALRRLRKAAKRNEALLTAARAGLVAAHEVLRPRPSTGFQGYTAKGTSDQIGLAKPTLEKRS